jgi:hypothetical protein
MRLRQRSSYDIVLDTLQRTGTMSRRWFGSNKVAEEAGELVQELMKLQSFPDGKHPARKRSLVLSTEDELADIIAAADYFIDRNRLDRKRIEKRRKTKYRKFERWWGKTSKPKSKKSSTKSKKSAGLK